MSAPALSPYGVHEPRPSRRSLVALPGGVDHGAGAGHHVPVQDRRRSPAKQAMNLLMVEDSAADGRLVLELLREAGVPWQLERVERVKDAEQHLQRRHVDCVLLDLGVLDADGLDGLRRLVAAQPDLPVVVLTRRDDELLSSEALRHGAQDYLSKRDLDPVVLARSVRYAVERKATELQLLHLANHDSLTGVANRGLLLEQLSVALAGDEGVGVLYLDVDSLKLVNDSYGHDAGDVLLRTVARRMQVALRPSDVVGRLGGDEFAVVCGGLVDEERAAELARRLVDEIAQPLLIGTRVYVPSVSIGVAVHRPGSLQSTDEALGDADLALLLAKRRGKARVEVFHEGLRSTGGERMALLTELRTALVEDQFRVHFQPQVDLATGRLVAVEALVRWEHPTRGLVPAGAFVEVVEDSDMVATLGAWVLDRACSALAGWPGAERPRMAVNISPRQFSLPGFPALVQESLARYGIAPADLELEVTESALLVDDSSAQVLRDLHDMGLRLAVDDFGTGYSSLQHLKLFPAQTVKVDRSFVTGLGADAVDDAIVTAVISVATTLGLTTVGEGVEDEQQAARLRQLGCSLGQGFLYARAMSVEELYRRYA